MADPFARVEFSKRDQQALDQLIQRTEPESLFNAVFQRMGRLAQLAAAHVIRTSLSGQLLKRRTGSLARSVIGRAEMIEGVPAIRVGIFRGPATAYAGALEHGATIRPKRARALAIPQKAALTPAGVDRWGGPRGYPGRLRFIPFRSSGIAVGRLVDENEARIAAIGGNERLREIQTFYLLVRQVKIPAYHWLSKPIREFLPQIARELGAYFREELTRAKKS